MSVIYFKDVPEIGNLYWDKLLFRFENYDMLFTCRDDADQLYFCLCDDCLYGNYSWLVTAITEERLEDVTSRRIEILTPFKEAEKILVADYCGYNTNNPECTFQWCKYSEIDPEELPHKDMFFPKSLKAELTNPYLL